MTLYPELDGMALQAAQLKVLLDEAQEALAAAVVHGNLSAVGNAALDVAKAAETYAEVAYRLYGRAADIRCAEEDAKFNHGKAQAFEVRV